MPLIDTFMIDKLSSHYVYCYGEGKYYGILDKNNHLSIWPYETKDLRHSARESIAILKKLCPNCRKSPTSNLAFYKYFSMYYLENPVMIEQSKGHKIFGF